MGAGRDLSQVGDGQHLAALLGSAQALHQASHGVGHRTADTRVDLVEDQGGNALAIALLHEFRHVMYCADKSAPSTLPEEEIGCDNWAREFMTSGLAAYAKEHRTTTLKSSRSARWE